MTGAALLLAALAAPGPVQRLGPPPPARVQRVVTLAPSLTETVLSLGRGEALVGVSRFDERAEVAGLPRVGGFSDVGVESVLALQPDVLLVQQAPGNQRPVEALARLGLPVLAFRLRTVDDVLAMLRALGALLGQAAQGEAQAARLEALRAQVRARADAAGPGPTVLVVYGFKPLVVAGPGSFAHELLGDVGARNQAGRAATAYPVYSLEQLTRAPPQVLLDVSDADEGRARVKALPALKAARWVSPQSRGLLQPGPSLGEALEELEKLLR